MIISIISLIDMSRVGKINKKVYWIFCVFLIFFAAFRPEYVDRDYAAYEYWFNIEDSLHVEISFSYISSLIKKLNGNLITLFILYAILGVGIKFYALKIYSKYVFSSVVVYIGYLYNLQDLTQIRAGVSSAILLLSIKFIVERRLYYFLFCWILASLFHYSAFFIVFFYFIDYKRINKLYYIIAIILSYLLLFIIKNPIEIITGYLPLFVQAKMMGYEYDAGSGLNIYNAWQLLRCLVAVVLILNIDIISARNKYFIIFLKLYVFGICSFILLSFNPVFSSRISDLFFISDLIIFTGFIYMFKQKIIGKIITIILSALFLYMNIAYIGIFND